MEFINRVRAHETIRLSVLSWIRYCSAITRFPVPGAVPGAEPGTHVHSHVVSDVILWRVLGKTGIFIAWVRIESLRDHRTCQIPLEKFMVPSQFTLWSAVLWCLLALCRKKIYWNENHVLGCVRFFWKEQNTCIVSKHGHKKIWESSLQMKWDDVEYLTWYLMYQKSSICNACC